ncbi:MAG: hypothetical protein H7Z21_02800 [Hymenobacter sp.]|nr:hypothetical protein [Hymenobacter sp.]
MSIFPKRTLRGSQVTIHWNFNTATLTETHIVPYVRIGVYAPNGQLTLLHDGHILRLPGLPAGTPAADVVMQTLPKSVPLLVLADYLSGRQARAALVDMLRGIHTGRHYYFTYPVPPDAPLGKYTLLSEVYVDGQVRYSGTAADDFFLVEELQLGPGETTPTGGLVATLTNSGPESVPIRVVDYQPARQPTTASYVREVPAQGALRVESTAAQCFVLYNEEREVLPIALSTESGFLRNQQLLSLDKEVEGQAVTYVLAGEADEAYELSGPSREVWQRADGLAVRSQLVGSALQTAYQEMLEAGLIQELPR